MDILVGIFFFFLLHTSSGTPAYSYNPPSSSCNDDQLRQCADNAEPVLRGSDFVVPATSRAVNQVCSVWVELTNCIGNYTKRCLTPNKRVEFETATKDPISAMTSFCGNPEQQNDYLNHAPCVKRITTQDKYCGKQYKFLIDLVGDGTIKQVCCARAKFMNCLMERTPESCEKTKNDSAKKSPTMLAVALLDSSLAFMSQRCESSRFQESDCPGIDVPRENSKGPLTNAGQDTTQFQLDQGHQQPQQQGGWIEPNGSGSSAKRPTTTTKEIKERPVADQFASTAGNKQRPQANPGGRGGSGEIRGNSGHLVIGFVSIAIFRVFMA